MNWERGQFIEFISPVRSEMILNIQARVYKGLQEFTGDYKGLQGITRIYRGLQEFMRIYRGLQGFTRD